MLDGCLSIIFAAELTPSARPRYPAHMETFRLIATFWSLAGVLFAGSVALAKSEQAEEQPVPVPAEEYLFYDQVIDEKFLTSAAALVLIERLTVTRLFPDQQDPITLETFREQGFFEGRLPMDLVREFVFKNQKPSRLEERFGFGVRYRFIAPDGSEQPEVSLAPIPVLSLPLRPTEDVPFQEAPSVIDRLAFSRVAFTLKNDQALVYVENNRPDESGAGFLVWLRRRDGRWSIVESEVVWTAQPGQEPVRHCCSPQ